MRTLLLSRRFSSALERLEIFGVIITIFQFQVYYDLLNKRKEMGLDDKIAIHTIEQISPFPFDIMKKVR